MQTSTCRANNTRGLGLSCQLGFVSHLLCLTYFLTYFQGHRRHVAVILLIAAASVWEISLCMLNGLVRGSIARSSLLQWGRSAGLEIYHG